MTGREPTQRWVASSRWCEPSFPPSDGPTCRRRCAATKALDALAERSADVVEMVEIDDGFEDDGF
jgi:hypothetical protein